MLKNFGKIKRSNLASFFILFILVSGLVIDKADAANISTNVRISVCGDAVVTGVEICDAGVGFNTGDYSGSIAGRVCSSDCMSWGPYCGDSILQARFSEECDDGNNVSEDYCSLSCTAEDIPTGGGQSGSPQVGSIPGGGGFTGAIPSYIETKVLIRGKAYPNSNVNILLDGAVLGIVKADTNADFLFSTTDITPGTATFGFWAEDQGGLRSVAFTATFDVAKSAVTTVDGVFLPPTIDVSASQLKAGELITISGQSVPDVQVFTQVHSEDKTIVQAETGETGEWAVQLDTASLEPDIFHTAKAYFELEALGEGVIQSGFSRSISFFVGNGSAPNNNTSADINGDGKVNLIDFSIFLIYWGGSEIKADFNLDGSVDLADFSIMLFYWTG